MKLSNSLGDYRFPASYLNTLVHAWKASGLNETALLERAHLQQRYPLPADSFVTGHELLRLYVAGTEQYQGKEPFSLKLAQHFNFTSVGLLGLAVVTADSLKQVMELLQRYFPLIFPGVSIQSLIEPPHLQLRYRIGPEFGAAVPFLTEVIAGVIKRFTVYFKGHIKPERIEFSHREPRYGAASIEYFECKVSYGASVNCLYFSIDDLQVSPSMAEPSTLVQLEKQLDDILQKHSGEPLWSDRVRTAWLERVDAGLAASLEDLAQMFNLTTRTLERRLQQESTSYSQIIQEMRARRASELLTDRTLSVGEIAYRIGFQDSNAFTRFFKQATGLTPAAFRAQLLER